MKITCRQAVDYISKKEEGKLSATQRFALWRHLAICSLCRMFSAQNKMMIKAMQHQDDNNAQLTPEEKESMVSNIMKRRE